jgi:hypothetical protein
MSPLSFTLAILRKEARPMQVVELSYGEAVDKYFALLRAEGHTIIDQPGESSSYREADGWRLRNIRGDLAYVLDSGEFGDLSDLPADEW